MQVSIIMLHPINLYIFEDLLSCLGLVCRSCLLIRFGTAKSRKAIFVSNQQCSMVLRGENSVLRVFSIHGWKLNHSEGNIQIICLHSKSTKQLCYKQKSTKLRIISCFIWAAEVSLLQSEIQYPHSGICSVSVY